MDYSQYVEQFNQMTPAQQTSTSVFAAVVVILGIIAEWKIFTKAGESGWFSLIPILREYKLVKIADGKGIKVLLLLIPVVNVIYALLLDFRLAKAFGKGILFGLGLIFFPNIFMLILGFGSSQYIGPRGNRN